jgi:hypothetical protein
MSGYVSKDFVHTGCGLALDPDLVWDTIPYSVQKNIKKASKEGVAARKVAGNADDIAILKSMWYDPEDPNMPNQLNENEFMFIAEQNGEPIGAVILLPVGNHLFLNNLAGNPAGKQLRVQDFLLWHCVNHFAGSKFKYIDVGVSYRESLYNFFKKWKSFGYPVIFNPPQIKLNISLKPFTNNNLIAKVTENETEILKTLKAAIGSDAITFVPSAEQAIQILTTMNLEPIERTHEWKSATTEPYYIDLSKIFAVQFGALIVNLEIGDKDMWNNHHCLDVFKRQFVFSTIANELLEMDLLIALRKRNKGIFEELFIFEDIEAEKKNEFIPSAFYFRHEHNVRFNKKLNEFGIEHIYTEETGEIGLPIHQNLNRNTIEYVYAIFRGVLNLCSEWIHTDTYNDMKD